MSTALAFAFGAGLLATVNPCGLALLPGFLGLYLDAGKRGSLLSRVAEGFAVGALLSASFASVFLLGGMLVSAGLRSFVDLVPWLAAAIGVGLLGIGLAMVAGRRFGLAPAGRITVGAASAHGYRRVAAFGATYALASLSCTLGVFLVVVGQALATNGALEFFAVFGAYAGGSATVLIALSVSAAVATGTLLGVMRRLAPVVNRLAGALLALSGAYLVLYWLPTLLGDDVPDSPLIRFSARLSSTLSGFFSQRTTLFAIVLTIVVGLGLAASAAERRRRHATAPTGKRARERISTGGA